MQRRHAGQQDPASLDVLSLASREHQRIEAADFVCKRVDLGRRSAARSADGLILLPPFARGRTVRANAVLSTIEASGGSLQATSAVSRPCQIPFLLQRSKRLNSAVRGPYSAGMARQRRPSLINKQIRPLTTYAHKRFPPCWLPISVNRQTSSQLAASCYGRAGRWNTVSRALA